MLLPGSLVARALGLRGVSATLAWRSPPSRRRSAVVFASSTRRSRWRSSCSSSSRSSRCRFAPRRRAGPARGRLAGRVAGGGVAARRAALARRRRVVRRRALPPRARAQAASSSTGSRSRQSNEFADGGLHPGYAFPLWHGFLALVAKLAGVDPALVVQHEATLLVPLAVRSSRTRPAYALFRSRLARRRRARRAGRADRLRRRVTAARTRRSRCPAPRRASSLVPAALALVFALRARRRRRPLLAAIAAGRARARARPPDVRGLPLPAARRLPRRARRCGRAGGRGGSRPRSPRSPCRRRRVVAWLLPIVRDTASHTPDGRGAARARSRTTRDQLDVCSDEATASRPEVFGAAARSRSPRSLLVPLAALACAGAGRAFVLGGSLAVLAVDARAVALHALLRRSSRSRSRGAPPASCRSRSRSRAGSPCSPRCCAASCSAARARPPGIVLQARVPRRLRLPARGRRARAVTWFARRRRRDRARARRVAYAAGSTSSGTGRSALAAALFVLPVASHGFAHWNRRAGATRRAHARARATRCATTCPKRDVVFSDLDDELPDRRRRAGLRRRRAAGARRRHEDEPAVRAPARRDRVLPHRRPRDPAPRTARDWLVDRPAAVRRRDAARAARLRDGRYALYRPRASLRSPREGAARDAVLPAGRRRRRAAAAEVRDASAGARDRDARARAGRPEVDPPRRRAPPPTPGVGAPRPLRRARGAQAGGGAARHAGARAARHAGAAASAALLVPDENVDLEPDRDPGGDPDRARARGSTSCITTSPPDSVHLVGAAVQARDRRALGRRPARLARRAPAPARGARRSSARRRGSRAVARLVARSADAIVAVSDAIAEEARGFGPAGRCVTIANGSRLRRLRRARVPRRAERFRITHTGSFFGKRDPRPFLTALAESRPRRGRALRRRLPQRRPRVGGGARARRPHRAASRTCRAARALELQRDSEALLLLIPEAGGRGSGVLSGKVFEYLAAERPILAAVPPDGAAAELIRETGAGVVVAPDDVDALRARAGGAPRRFVAGTLAATRPARTTASASAALRGRGGRRAAGEPPSSSARASRADGPERAAGRRPARHGRRRSGVAPHRRALPRHALLRHVREGALGRSPATSPRRRADALFLVSFAADRLAARDARVPRTDLRRARLLRARSSSSTCSASSTSRRGRRSTSRQGDGQVRDPLPLPRRPASRTSRGAPQRFYWRTLGWFCGGRRGERRLRGAAARRRRAPGHNLDQRAAVAAHGRRELDQHLRRRRGRERLPAERAHRRPEPPRDHAARPAARPRADLPAARARAPPARAARRRCSRSCSSSSSRRCRAAACSASRVGVARARAPVPAPARVARAARCRSRGVAVVLAVVVDRALRLLRDGVPRRASQTGGGSSVGALRRLRLHPGRALARTRCSASG